MFFDRHFRNWFRQARDEHAAVELKVHLAFDEEANVWYVAQSDIPGLHLEADGPDELVRRIEECAPEMIELNHAEIVRTYRPKQEVIRVKPIFDSPFKIGGLASAC